MKPSDIYYALIEKSIFVAVLFDDLPRHSMKIDEKFMHCIKRVFLLQDRLMTYQDSGFSEEDQDHQVTTCLMKTPSGSIYIQPTSKIASSFWLNNVIYRIE